jgi:hypothetical protein
MEIRREARKVCCMLAAFLVLRAPGFVLCAARRSRMANIGAETKETKIPRLTKTSLERALMLGPTLTRRLWRGVAPKVWPRDAQRVIFNKVDSRGRACVTITRYTCILDVTLDPPNAWIIIQTMRSTFISLVIRPPEHGLIMQV